MSLIPPSITNSCALSIIEEPIGLACNIPIVLIVESLIIGSPNILVACLSLMESSHCMGSHDGHSLFSAETKVVFHESYRHGAIEVFVGGILFLLGIVGIPIAVLSACLKNKWAGKLDSALIFALKLSAHDWAIVRRPTVTTTCPIVPLNTFFDGNKTRKSPQVSTRLSSAL